MKKLIAILFLFLLIFSLVITAFAADTATVQDEVAEAEVTKNQIITLAILVIAAIFFVTEVIPLALTAMSVPIALNLTGVLDAKTAFGGFSDSNVILFAGMFVVGAALFETGVAKKIGDAIIKKTGTSELKLTLGIMIVSASLSSVLSNTGTTAVLLPVSIGIARSAGWNRSKVLMPLAYAAALGGMITLVGTPPNLIVNGVLNSAQMRQFGFFEFAWIGIPMTFLGIIYMMTIGRKLLPNRIVPAEEIDDISTKSDYRDYKVTKQWTAIGILLSVLIVMALDLMPLHIIAVAGALLAVFTGCLNEKKAYSSIDWTTIFLFAGMLPLAHAMDNTGTGLLIAESIIGISGQNVGPYLFMTVIFFVTAALTQFMSNTAATALLAPVGLHIATGMGANPQAILMTIAIAASAAFATPIGTPPNTLILGPGNYRFIDYVKVGTPLIVVSYIISIIVIPILWPFF